MKDHGKTIGSRRRRDRKGCEQEEGKNFELEAACTNFSSSVMDRHSGTG